MDTERKIYALGFFDGVHLGHQALLCACCRLATEQNAFPTAVTFDLPPSAVLQHQQPNMLSTLRDRERLLMGYGIKKVVQYPATEQTLSLSWQKFLQQLLRDGAAGFVCGEDFRFGHKGEGDAQKLSEFATAHALPCVIIPEQRMDGEKISSSRIRKLLEAGHLREANRLLGHPHLFTGTVVAGQKLGRTIGIPTANLRLPPELLTPALGVYACKAEVDGKSYMAVTNVGTRPTVNGNGITVEPWLLDFDGDLYGKELSLYFYEYLRKEQKFDNLTVLQQEILKNGAEVRKIFEKY